jgi:hypothetical protein
MEVTIREWVRPVYGSYSDNIAQGILLISIFFLGLSVGFSLAPHVMYQVLVVNANPWLYLGVAAAMAGLSALLFDSGRADQFAAEVRAQWPALAAHAKFACGAFCLLSILLLIASAIWARATMSK